ncbi:uncharacterized protein LOC132797238 [Drosophila nasuta]|uniref:Uncharacterized protein LOC117578186 n=1 Tax=Drosophila albomicans TaxID=7291 RepID=A0A6P8Y0E2_DROAB|nr:uncharacterized protein LOC117578186 [Drosophila albomicans]XP_034119393.1 uncharacterized protein LOC117578186 [Drosophila albomicans]XP_060664836.1 uncharacterized protein LOC132797238 [Drosophila nasuta]XP_060664837.1 uncharacterized protein LOC132797238 [Drosophila nasuta]
MAAIGNPANNNANEFNGRHSASPARTIDSHDSTTGSMDTIVDRSLNREELLQVANTIEQSTNATNAGNGGSLTNSQIAMLQSDNEQQQRNHQQQQQLQQQEHEARQQLDAQSHIYSSPVYDEKPMPPLKLTAATLLANVDDNAKKPKLISHEEFKQQLEEAMATRNQQAPTAAAAASAKSISNTIDSRISKKQRCPPEFIKYKGGSGSGSGSGSDAAGSTMSAKVRRKRRASNECCSAFPLQIVLGTLQLVLAISLVALGSLLIVRDAALSMAGCGIWTGLIAAVTGSLGVVSMRKTQTAFLALSLVCIASSTLALAISGVGLSRDLNRLAEQKGEQFDLMNANSEVSAACGLIFALFLHFVVSIVSVYRCALQICTKSQHSELRDVIIKSNGSGMVLDQQKVDQYIKAMSLNGSEKVNNEKLAAMWMYAAHMGSLPPPTVRKLTPPSRSIMLIPATAAAGNGMPPPPPTRLPPAPPGMGAGMLLPVPPPPQYRGMTLPPYMRPSSMLYAHPASLTGTYRTHKSTKSAEMNGQRRRRRAGKSDANRRQRRKSEADVLDGAPNFQYTGLDRAIADSFLARQEQSQAGSHIDYSSSTSSANSDAYGNQTAAGSRPSSKSKIVCRDVVM